MKSIYNKALKLAVPMIIQNGITNMVLLVDNLMVGSLGTEAMSGVSIVGQLMFVFNLAIFGGLSGPGIYAAQYYGKGDREGFRNTFRIKIYICLVCLLGGLFAFSCFGENLINLYLHGESENIDMALTLSLAKKYLAIMLLNTIPFVITQIYASSLRETGESITPMIAGIVSVVFDIVFNYFLIYGKWVFPRLGVEGAAIATVIARVSECLVVVFWTHIRRDKYDFIKGIYKKFLVPWNIAFPIIKKGLPIFLNEFLWSAGIAVLTQCYSLRGPEIIAGFNISNAICNLFNVVFVAMGHAVGILIGQRLGASEYEEAKKDSFALMKFTAFLCIILCVILVAAAGVFPKAYDTSPEVRRMATRFIIITALFFPIQGFLNALYFTLRSGGKTVVTFLFDSVFSWSVAVPVAFVLSYFTGLSIYAIYITVQAIDIIKVMVGYVLINKGLWITNLVDDGHTV